VPTNEILSRTRKFSFEVLFLTEHLKILFSVSRPRVLIEQYKRRSRIRGELVEFRALKVTCVFVSLACPISSDVLINAKRSEESLAARIKNYLRSCQVRRIVYFDNISLGQIRPSSSLSVSPFAFSGAHCSLQVCRIGRKCLESFERQPLGRARCATDQTAEVALLNLAALRRSRRWWAPRWLG